MLRQMGQRLPTAGESAVWLWAKTRRDDLRQHIHAYSGQVADLPEDDGLVGAT